MKRISAYIGLMSLGLVVLYVMSFFSSIKHSFLISILLLIVSECLSIVGLLLTIQRLKKEGIKRYTIVAILTNGAAFLLGNAIFAGISYYMIFAFHIDQNQFGDLLGK